MSSRRGIGAPEPRRRRKSTRAQIASILSNRQRLSASSGNVDRSSSTCDVSAVDLRTLLETLIPFVALYVAAASVLSWLVLPWLARRLDSNPLDGVLYGVVWAWLKLWHHPSFEGLEAIPKAWPKGLIVVANHASGVDPFLVQVCIPRRIRWMMAQEQMVPALDAVWRYLELIPVTYGPADAAGFRDAVRHVQRGGVLGIFPEGGIARPPKEVRPFSGGVGLIVARAKVPVVLFLIEGTPAAPTARESLFRKSRSRVRCLGWLDYTGTKDAAAVTADLRRRLAEASGWPLNHEPLAEAGGSSPDQSAAEAPDGAPGSAASRIQP